MSQPRVLIFMAGDENYVGLWRADAVPGWRTVPIVRSVPEGNQVLQALDALLHESSVPLTQITHVGVMRGPASYTQLRLVVTTANALAWALGLPLFGFSSEVSMPDSIPQLLVSAKVNIPIIPVYPTDL